jgi:hypothetical protein
VLAVGGGPVDAGGSFTVSVIVPPTMVMFVNAGPSRTGAPAVRYAGTVLGFVVAARKHN